MVNLYDYDLLVNDVFYRCWHILEYIERHPNMSDLEKEAIKATIMDALVTKKLIDPNSQSLDFDKMCIVNNLSFYTYDKHPNICGIPLWMKEKFREKSIYVTGGIPVSIFLAKPPSKIARYCVFDPNTAVSSIFEDATFYNAIYNSPTRNIRIDEARPFVEVLIDDELYLVDTLTKRIFKSSWFKEKYNFEVKSEYSISKMDKEKLGYYKRCMRKEEKLSLILPFALPVISLDVPSNAEYKYEILQSKKYFPGEWENYYLFEKQMSEYQSMLNKK